jgi:hypothetical protein
MFLGGLSKLSDAVTRCVTAENVYGEKGRGGMAEVSDAPQPEVARIGQAWDRSGPARELGRGWKVRPSIRIPAGGTATIMDVQGPGVVQHLWITLPERFYRDVILRMYWDDEAAPSVETPVGDFFCNGFARQADVLAVPIASYPAGGLNSYFPMPFGTRARITAENRAPTDECPHLFYAITFALMPIDDEGRFHAQFRRTNPLPYRQPYTVVDGVRGRGHYVGTYMAWQQNAPGWWGEGEIKFYLDGDAAFPTVCGTGTEDYFGGAWGFGGRTFSGPFAGYPLGGEARPGARHGLYRFHVTDPIRFRQDLRVTMQALGWRSERRYLPLQDDISSVAYWYQREPHQPFPALPARDDLEAVQPTCG